MLNNIKTEYGTTLDALNLLNINREVAIDFLTKKLNKRELQPNLSLVLKDLKGGYIYCFALRSNGVGVETHNYWALITFSKRDVLDLLA